MCDTRPTITDLFSNSTPAPLYGVFAGELFCVIISFICVARQALKLYGVGSKRADLYLSILMFGPSLCLMGFLSSIFPRMTSFYQTTVSLYLAVIVYDLAMLMINFIAGENVHDPREAKRKYAQFMSSLPANDYLRVPPCGCLFLCGPCSNHDIIHPSTQTIITICLTQFRVIVPLLSLYRMCLQLQNNPDASELDSKNLIILRVFYICSTMLAVWAIMVLNRLTKGYLVDFKPMKKFRIIQLSLVVLALLPLGLSYLSSKYYLWFGNTTYEASIEFRADFWNSVCSCVYGFLITFALKRIFPLSEIQSSFLFEESIRSPLNP